MKAEWTAAATPPCDNQLVDVRFDTSTAEIDGMGSMAEFYVPGSTRRHNPVEPIIRRVRYRASHYRPLVDDMNTELHAILSVTITHWRDHIPA